METKQEKTDIGELISRLLYFYPSHILYDKINKEAGIYFYNDAICSNRHKKISISRWIRGKGKFKPSQEMAVIRIAKQKGLIDEKNIF